MDALVHKVEYLKASVRANVKHLFRVIKRQFGYVKLRDRELKKNTVQLVTLFALSNLWMARGRVLAMVKTRAVQETGAPVIRVLV